MGDRDQRAWTKPRWGALYGVQKLVLLMIQKDSVDGMPCFAATMPPPNLCLSTSDNDQGKEVLDALTPSLPHDFMRNLFLSKKIQTLVISGLTSAFLTACPPNEPEDNTSLLLLLLAPRTTTTTTTTTASTPPWTAAISGTTNNLNGIIYANSTFWAVGDAGTLVKSANGTSWTTVNLGGITTNLQAIIWTGTTYVIVGSGGQIAHSTDGTTWTTYTLTSTYTNYAIAFDGTTYVATGTSTGSDAALSLSTSLAGAGSWTQGTNGTSGPQRSLIVVGSAFYGVGNSGHNQRCTATCGTLGSWISSQLVGGTSMRGMVYQSPNFYIGAGNGNIFTPTTAWSTFGGPVLSETTAHNGIVYDGSRYVTVTAGGTVWAGTSTTSSSWTLRSRNTGVVFNGVAYDGSSKYVAVGNTGAIYTNPKY